MSCSSACSSHGATRTRGALSNQETWRLLTCEFCAERARSAVYPSAWQLGPLQLLEAAAPAPSFSTSSATSHRDTTLSSMPPRARNPCQPWELPNQLQALFIIDPRYQHPTQSLLSPGGSKMLGEMPPSIITTPVCLTDMDQSQIRGTNAKPSDLATGVWAPGHSATAVTLSKIEHPPPAFPVMDSATSS